MTARILIVDDSPIIRECLCRLLAGHNGWEICGEASNGEDAIRKTRELEPDLVVMDFLMPEKNGIEAARIINHSTRKIPVLLCTICLTPQLDDLARGAGIAGAISKGDLNQVVPSIETLLRGGSVFTCHHQLEAA